MGNTAWLPAWVASLQHGLRNKHSDLDRDDHGKGNSNMM